MYKFNHTITVFTVYRRDFFQQQKNYKPSVYVLTNVHEHVLLLLNDKKIK